MRISKSAWFVAAAGITLATVSCGSSSNTTTPTSTSRGAATGSTATTPATSTGAGSNKVQITMSGDLNGAFTPDSTAPVTCTQAPPKIVLQGATGGHRGTITITGNTAGGNIDVSYLPDGVGGDQYLADHIPVGGGDSRGSVTLNADGSGQLDIVLQHVPGGTFNGTSDHLKGTWTC
jgi:hypothetical protein